MGFFHGAALPDPARLLQGTGEFMRRVKLRPRTPTNAAALSTLIDVAYAGIKSPLSPLFLRKRVGHPGRNFSTTRLLASGFGEARPQNPVPGLEEEDRQKSKMESNELMSEILDANLYIAADFTRNMEVEPQRCETCTNG